tara:strand:+ start:1095 stop:1454 length:360 start_codon:yes stop_codon:yes gene_type:complete
MAYKQPIDYTSKQLAFQKLQKKVRRISPKATSHSNANGTFTVLDRNNRSVIREEHLMQPATSVSQAWQQAAVCVHADRVISGNGKAFKASKKARELTAAMENFLDDSHIFDDEDAYINN